MDQFRVIIAGTRTFQDYDLLCRKCDFFFANKRPTAIVCGEARGADSLGKKYAKEHNLQVDSFPADWNKYGKRAGYIRNREMAEHARGTQHMINLAKEYGLPYRVVLITSNAKSLSS